MPLCFGITISLLLGLCFGSFLNCLVYRLAEKKTILGRSFCPKCFHQLVWYENIPLISYILLKGRCRYCQEKISWGYPLVELSLGFLFVFVFLQNPFQWHLIFSKWFIFFILVFIFVYDLKYQEIELIILWPAIGIVFALDLISGQALNLLFISMGIGASFFLVQYLITKGKGIGLGDVWIGIFMGSVLVKPEILAVALFFAYLIGAIISLILLISKRGKLKTKIPLAPFLVVGTFVALFAGQKITDWYLSRLIF